MYVNVKNIYGVGRNYHEHVQELNNSLPESPLLFIKPTHSLAEANGKEIILPGNKGELQYEIELVIHIAKKYEPGINPEELIDLTALGIDFTLRDVQTDLKKRGYPWVLAKGFRNSAVISPWQQFNGIEALKLEDFTLERNGLEVQRGNIKDMIFDIPTIVDFIGQNLGLDKGDICFTGTPAGVGPVSDGDVMIYKWGQKQVGSCKVKLNG